MRLVATRSADDVQVHAPIRVARSIPQRWPTDLAWPADTPGPAPELYAPRGTDWRKHSAAPDAVSTRTCPGRDTGESMEDAPMP